MTTRVVPAVDGSLYVDCFAPLTEAQLDRLCAATYGGESIAGFGRYIENLTQAEIDNVLNRGKALFTIGVAHADSMATPNAGLGSRDGLHAVSLLRALGVPPGVTHGLDVEGTVKASGDDVVAYVNAATAVIRTQTGAAFYEGWGIALGAADLYHRLATSLYWASSPHSLAPAVRGFACIQVVENITLAGVAVDVDRMNVDLLGGRFQVLTAA